MSFKMNALYLLAGVAFTLAAASPAFKRQAECEVDECWEADLSTADAYGFYYSPGFLTEDTYTKPFVAEYRFPKQAGSDMEFEATRVGFLRFNTDLADIVDVYINGNATLEDPFLSFSGNYDEEGDLPTLGNGIRNKKLSMVFTAEEEGEAQSGFMFAYGSSIPADLTRETKQEKAPKKAVDNSMPLKKKVIKADFASKSITVDDKNMEGLMRFEISEDYQVGEYGFLMSPNHPSLYPENEDNTVWVYELVAAEDQVIALYFLRFETEVTYDGVTITDHASGEGVYLDGSNPLRTVWLSTGNSATLTFHPDSSISYTGFLAAFAGVPAGTAH